MIRLATRRSNVSKTHGAQCFHQVIAVQPPLRLGTAITMSNACFIMSTGSLVHPHRRAVKQASFKRRRELAMSRPGRQHRAIRDSGRRQIKSVGAIGRKFDKIQWFSEIA